MTGRMTAGRMLPGRMLIVAAALLMATLMCAPVAQADSKVLVHMIVVPAEVKPGGNLMAELTDLKIKLAELAGGYTEIGNTEGGSLSKKGLDAEYNYTFMVAAKSNITKEVEEYVDKHFNGKPFILVWDGSMNR